MKVYAAIERQTSKCECGHWNTADVTDKPTEHNCTQCGRSFWTIPPVYEVSAEEMNADVVTLPSRPR